MVSLTTVKKAILKFRTEQSMHLRSTFLFYFMDVMVLERATARLNQAKADTMVAWSTATDSATKV